MQAYADSHKHSKDNPEIFEVFQQTLTAIQETIRTSPNAKEMHSLQFEDFLFRMLAIHPTDRESASSLLLHNKSFFKSADGAASSLSQQQGPSDRKAYLASRATLPANYSFSTQLPDITSTSKQPVVKTNTLMTAATRASILSLH